MTGAGLMHKGQPIELGGVVYTIPPLSLGAVELYEEQLEQMESLPRAAQLRLIVDVAFAAMRRNYPAMTRAEVAELVDLANANQVYAAVMASTIPAVDPEASKAGELGAMTDGTGSTSTPTSPPVLGTPSPTAEST
jgi:hypothetical protein